MIAWLLPSEGRAPHLGDLRERFEKRLERDGERAAHRWYVRQALSFLVRIPPERWILQPVSRLGVLARRATAGLGHDLRFAARSLRSRPGFSLPVISILALGVAANSVVFAFVDTVMLRELPCEDPDSLVMLWDRTSDGRRVGLGYARYREWSKRADLFAGIGAFETGSPVVETGGRTERLNGILASASVFKLLGVDAELGRTFREHEDTLGGPRVAVISHRLWRTRFGADPDAVGRSVRVNGEPTILLGVMPEDFWFYDPYMFVRSSGPRDAAHADIWLPLHTRDWASPSWRDYPALRVLARLHSRVSVVGARGAVEVTARTLPRPSGRGEWRTELVPLSEEVVRDVRPRLTLLFGACLLVMLVASMNIMSLVLARGLSRSGELAIRSALGASSWRIRRLVAGEGLLLGITAAGVGSLAAWYGLEAAVGLSPRDLPLAGRVALDARVIAFTLVLGVVAGLAGALLPISRIRCDRSPADTGTAGDRVTAGVADRRLQSALVALEVAVTVTLLIAAVMLMQSFIGLVGADTGFDERDVLTFQSTVSHGSEGPPPPDAFFLPLLEWLRELPAVEAAGASSHLPFTEWGRSVEVVIGNEEPDPDTAGPRVGLSNVTEGFFGAAGIPIRAGRGFRPADGSSSRPVVVVNEAFAEAHLGGEPLGESVGLVFRGHDQRVERHVVVGIVGNVKRRSLAEAPRPQLYASFRQRPSPMLTFVVRSAGDPSALVPVIRGAAREIDPGQALEQFARWEFLVRQSITEERFYSRLLAAFGFTALCIAATGVYGTVSYGVAARLREMGIRKAFGAGRRSIATLVLLQGLTPVACGAALGGVGAALTTRSLRALLHDVSPLDPTSFVVSMVTVLLVAAVATLPALVRATGVDAADILRS